MPHQVEALRRLTLRPSRPSSEDVMAWLMEMGTGKTKVILDEWQARVGAGDLDQLLVFAPTGAYRNWWEDKTDLQRAELRVHLDPELMRRLVLLPWQTGASRRETEIFEAGMRLRGRPRAMFVNVEAVSTSQRAVDAVAEFLAASRRTMVVMDESTRIRGPRATRSKMIVELGRGTAARRIMSGLVNPRSPMDLFMQYNFLDPRIIGQRDFFYFRHHYAVMRRVAFSQSRRGKNGQPIKTWVEVAYRNLADLRARIEPYSYRVLKSECMSLPEKQYAVRYVALTEQQKRLYVEMRDEALTELDGGMISAESKLQRLQKLHNIVLGHVRDDDTRQLHNLDSRRIDEVAELLHECEGKAIVWTAHVPLLLKIVERLNQPDEFGPGSVVAFYGGNRDERGECERRWLGDEKCRFIVSTQSSGGVGNTWNAAKLTIFASNSFDLEHRMQAEDRNHRKGQTNQVTYVDIVARGTVEEHVISALRRKLDLASLVSGDEYRKWLV